MSCSLSTFPTTREACPIAPVSALRAAVERLQQPDATAAGSVDVRRPNYLLDVPVSAIDVDRWGKRWQEAMAELSSSSPSCGVGTKGHLYFESASSAYTALMAKDDAGASAGARSMRHLAPFPPFVFSSVKTLSMTQLLKMRRQWLPHRQRFAVHQQRMGFLDAVLSHAVVALVGPVGSGRTLQVPIVLSETEVLKRRRLIIVSTNAASAKLTTMRLREERGEDVLCSRTVAVAIPTHNEVTECTSIVVTTADVMLRQLLCDPCLENVGCVVFDDAHLRSESTELSLSLLRDLLAAQQQWEHQLGAAAVSASASSPSGPTTADPNAPAVPNADGAHGGRLHVVLNCPNEACATTLLSFLAPSRCTATTFALQANPAILTAPVTLFLEEAVQWLLKSEKEGSCPIGDGAAMETALLSYAENVDAVARIMAAADADFAHPAAFRRYWLPLILQCVDEFDKADRQAAGATEARNLSPLSLILIVVPNNHYVHVVAKAVQEAQRNSAEGDPAASRMCTALAEDSPFADFTAVARRTLVKDAHQRWIIVATSELSQSVLPSTLDVGLVVDCARNGYTTVDTTAMVDTVVIEYSTIAQLRHRRKLAKMTTSPAASGDNNTPTSPMVIQLIPKSVLHGAHHRRLSADPAQHIVFRLPFSRYVQLYQVLQAREEAILSQRMAFSSAAGGGYGSGGGAPSLVTKVSTTLASHLIGVPAATATRYEPLRRIMASAESYLRAAGHLAVDTEPGSPAMGQLVLQPIAVLCLCMPLPLQVGRLLIAGSLLRPPLAAVTAVGALWCCSDLLSLQGAKAVRAVDVSDASRETVEELGALLTEARLFFSRDSLSDVVSAFNVYQMWCSTKGRPEAERDFLVECGVAREVLQAVFDTQVQLCMLVRTYGLELQPSGRDGNSGASAEESQADRALRLCVESVHQATSRNVEQVSSALGDAMAVLSPEVAMSSALHACITAALYPNTVVPTGDSGIGFLYDGIPTSSVSSANGTVESSAGGSQAPPATGRRVATFSSDCVLADPAQFIKAAGRAFLFLSKSIADASTREAAATASSSTVAATVVEQVDPLHEAAAFVFCGHFYERPRKAPIRCRGWSSVLTSRWRETRRARALPPVSQLPPTYIALQSYDTVHCDQVVCIMDQNLSLTMRATTAKWLQQLRTHVGVQLSALARGVLTPNKEKSITEASCALAMELTQAWEWWERRHREGRSWLREERVVVAHQQREKEEAETWAEGDEQKRAASAAKLAALRQRLFSYYEWQVRPGTPVSVVLPSNAERQAFAKSVAAAGAASLKGSSEIDKSVAAHPGGQDDGGGGDDVAGEGADTAQATYSGKVPPADVDHIFRLCVRSVAAKGTREAEAQLLRDNPDVFSFLNPEDEFHEYYLYLLRQAAPDMEVLGDNLEELIAFLEGLETELREELGLPDPNLAGQEDAGGALGGQRYGEDSASALGIWSSDGNDRENGQWNAGPFGSAYAVRDVPVGEGDLDSDGDGGGLQLESAAINLKKSAGPTLAEKIEEAKRAQAKAAPNTSNSTDGVIPMMGATPSVPVPMSVPAMQPPASSSAPFVSTSAGETLADKLRAMQIAALGGTPANANDVERVPFATQPTATSMRIEAEPVASTGVLPPPPTAADLLAVINGSDNSEAAHPDPSIGLGLQQAPPTAEELMALLGTAPPAAAASNSFGGIPSTTTLPSAAMAAMMMGIPATPLHRPPPAIPAKAIEERPPSVLVYPVPDIRKYGNVRLLLAKGLSDCLNMRVGPTTIVGHVARIDVPNRNVEARALALKKFTCGDTKITVHLFKNDRIIDDPECQERERRRRRNELRQEEAERHVERRRRTGGSASDTAPIRANAARGTSAVGTVPIGSGGIDPTCPDAYDDPSAYSVDAPVLIPQNHATKTTPMKIGVLSSSEDDDESSSSETSSASLSE